MSRRRRNGTAIAQPAACLFLVALLAGSGLPAAVVGAVASRSDVYATFTGYVYEGYQGDTSTPLSSV